MAGGVSNDSNLCVELGYSFFFKSDDEDPSQLPALPALPDVGVLLAKAAPIEESSFSKFIVHLFLPLAGGLLGHTGGQVLGGIFSSPKKYQKTSPATIQEVSSTTKFSWIQKLKGPPPPLPLFFGFILSGIGAGLGEYLAQKMTNKNQKTHWGAIISAGVVTCLGGFTSWYAKGLMDFFFFRQISNLCFNTLGTCIDATIEGKSIKDSLSSKEFAISLGIGICLGEGFHWGGRLISKGWRGTQTPQGKSSDPLAGKSGSTPQPGASGSVAGSRPGRGGTEASRSTAELRGSVGRREGKSGPTSPPTPSEAVPKATTGESPSSGRKRKTVHSIDIGQAGRSEAVPDIIQGVPSSGRATEARLVRSRQTESGRVEMEMKVGTSSGEVTPPAQPQEGAPQKVAGSPSKPRETSDGVPRKAAEETPSERRRRVGAALEELGQVQLRQRASATPKAPTSAKETLVPTGEEDEALRQVIRAALGERGAARGEPVPVGVGGEFGHEPPTQMIPEPQRNPAAPQLEVTDMLTPSGIAEPSRPTIAGGDLDTLLAGILGEGERSPLPPQDSLAPREGEIPLLMESGPTHSEAKVAKPERGDTTDKNWSIAAEAESTKDAGKIAAPVEGDKTPVPEGDVHPPTDLTKTLGRSGRVSSARPPTPPKQAPTRPTASAAPDSELDFTSLISGPLPPPEPIVPRPRKVTTGSPVRDTPVPEATVGPDPTRRVEAAEINKLTAPEEVTPTRMDPEIEELFRVRAEFFPEVPDVAMLNVADLIWRAFFEVKFFKILTALLGDTTYSIPGKRAGERTKVPFLDEAQKLEIFVHLREVWATLHSTEKKVEGQTIYELPKEVKWLDYLLNHIWKDDFSPHPLLIMEKQQSTKPISLQEYIQWVRRKLQTNKPVLEEYKEDEALPGIISSIIGSFLN